MMRQGSVLGGMPGVPVYVQQPTPAKAEGIPTPAAVDGSTTKPASAEMPADEPNIAEPAVDEPEMAHPAK